MDFLRNLFGKKHKTSSPSSSELNKNAKRTKSTKVKSVSAANIHELADHSRQDTKKLIDALGFEEPEAVKLASVVGEIRKWYWNRARSYSGRFGGVCDDCSSPLKHDEFYLTGSNSAICETCLDQHLFVHMEWGPALQNLQGQIGTTNVRVPQNILAVAADAARYIMDFRSKKIADGSLLKEVENAIGQPLTITTQGEFRKGARIEVGFVVELILTPENFWEQGNLKSLPEAITKMSKLTKLEIINHKLDSLPEVIGKLANLESLTINRNSLKGLPANIGDLTKLRSLSLDNNQIISLPESLWNLLNLETLILSDNKITSLSEQIGALQRLEWLMLNGNNLLSIPDSLLKLPNLKRIGIERNPGFSETSMAVIEALREKGCKVDL